MLALFFAFLVLDIYDVLSTIVGLLRDHLQEMNPVAVYLIGQMGTIPALILLKTIFLSLIGASIYAALKVDPHDFVDDNVLIGGLILLDILGLLVLSNNYSLIGWTFPFVFRFTRFF